MRCKRSSAGFTLIELVTSLVLLGIFALAVSSVVKLSSRIAVDSIETEQALAQSRYAIERLSRDIRMALPGSLRLLNGTATESWQCLELLPIVAASSYLTLNNPDSPSDQQVEVFRDASNRTIKLGQFAFVYPLTNDDVYPLTQVKQGNGLEITFIKIFTDTLELRFSDGQIFAKTSPLNRMFFTEQPVSYCFVKLGEEVQLWHYQQYGFKANQPGVTELKQFAESSLMAEGLTRVANVSLQDSNLMNNAVVQMNIGFKVDGKNLDYHQQVQVRNAP